MRSAISAVALMSLMVAVAGARTLAGAVEPASQEPTEVVLIATLHADHLLKPNYSLTHIRALLDKIDPDAVGIETYPGESDPDPEHQGDREHIGIGRMPESDVAVSWGLQAGVPVHGVTWADESLMESQQERMLRNARLHLSRPKEELEALFFERQFPRGVAMEARKVFGEDYQVSWGPPQERMTGELSDYGVDYIHSEGVMADDAILREQLNEEAWRSMEERDDRIAELILELARQHPGGRIAVIHGAAHYIPQVRRLSERSEVRVIPTTEFLPLSEDELESAWHRDDAIMMLGRSFDVGVARGAPHAVDHHRTKEQLERLAEAEPDSAATFYYRARWKMLFYDWEAAGPLLEQVREKDSETPLPYRVAQSWRWPPLPNFRALATFALANLYDMQGDHAAAVPYYRELLELETEWPFRLRQSPAVYVDLRAYLESLIAEPYQGGPREIFRIIEAYRAGD